MSDAAAHLEAVQVLRTGKQPFELDATFVKRIALAYLGQVSPRSPSEPSEEEQ